jgi:hypothetical protein|tara:strand:- start:65529 stop:66059 length:531 start_codon:yes stop_codon:yes gene_type:complete
MNVLNYEIRDFYTDIYLPSEFEILTNLYKQGIDADNLCIHTKYYKILFFNYISKTYIEALRNNKKKIFYIIGRPEKSELWDYALKNEIVYSYFLNIKKIIKLYPINALLTEEYTYNEFLEANEEELVEVLTKDIIKCREKNPKKSFKQLQSFVKTYELKYLDKQIFEEVQNRFIFS